MIESMVVAFCATFVAIAVIGHILLLAALIQCAGDDPAGGRRMPAVDRAHVLAVEAVA